MSYPEVEPGTRIIVQRLGQETKVMGNAAAFRTLERWMGWLAKAPPEEIFECHAFWHFNHGERGQPPCVRFVESVDSTDTAEVLDNDDDKPELTFQHVTEAILDQYWDK